MGRRPLPDAMKRNRLVVYVTDAERVQVLAVLDRLRAPVYVGHNTELLPPESMILAGAKHGPILPVPMPARPLPEVAVPKPVVAVERPAKSAFERKRCRLRHSSVG